MIDRKHCGGAWSWITSLGSGRGSAGWLALWSLADQGAVSLGNFLTHIILARTLPPREYGVFALLFGALIGLNALQSCVVNYPLSLRGSVSELQSLRDETRNALALTAYLAVPFGLIVAGATLLLGRPALALWAIAALYCWEMQEVLRRALMAHLRHAEAFWGDALSYLGQVSLIVLYLRTGHLSLPVVFGLIACTSLVAAALQALQLGVGWRGTRERVRYPRASWEVSRWALLATAAAMLPGIGFPWLLAMHGPQQAAAYQAPLNLTALTNPVTLSVSNVVLPATTRAGAAGRLSSWRALIKYGALGALLLLPCYLLLAFFPGRVMGLLYGPASSYSREHLALRLFLVGQFAAYVSGLLGAFFYGRGESKQVSKAQWLGVFAAVGTGIPLVSAYGVTGGAAGFAVFYLVQALAFLLLAEKAGPAAVPLMERT